jgi:hypothetical protein
MSSPRHIFVGGLHRSGTSLVASCLAGHSQADGFSNTGVQQDEGQFLQDVYPNVNQLGGAGRFGYGLEAHMTENAPWLSGDGPKKLRESWAKHWSSEASCVVEKTPQNLVMSRALQEVYPDSLFVFVLRHPIANALAVRKWTHSSLSSLALHWLRCHRWMIEDVPKLQNYVIVSYEDFVVRPQEICDQIWARVDLPSEKITARIDLNSNLNYQSTWLGMQATSKQILNRQTLGENTLSYGYRLRLAFTRRVMQYLVKPLWNGSAELTFGHCEYDGIAAEFSEEFERFGYTINDFLGFKPTNLL